MAERPRFAPWLPEDTIIQPIAHGGENCVTAYRTKHLARAQMFASRLTRIEDSKNPGRREITTIFTPFGTYTTESSKSAK